MTAGRRGLQRGRVKGGLPENWHVVAGLKTTKARSRGENRGKGDLGGGAVGSGQGGFPRWGKGASEREKA